MTGQKDSKLKEFTREDMGQSNGKLKEFLGRNMERKLVLAILGVLAVVGLTWAIEKGLSPTSKSELKRVAEDLVLQDLYYPHTADFLTESTITPTLEKNEWVGTGQVRAMNDLGEKRTVTYVVTFVYNEKQNMFWTISVDYIDGAY